MFCQILFLCRYPLFSMIPIGGSIISNKESDCNPVIHQLCCKGWTWDFERWSSRARTQNERINAPFQYYFNSPVPYVQVLLPSLVTLAKGERIVKRNDHKVLKRGLFILLLVTNVISNFAFQMQNLFHILQWIVNFERLHLIRHMLWCDL